ncbi:uncharacterized protein PV09_08088 [Verruconis gallopava]|uniref:GST N-terminal domain-containing protein n=1 Tax=Verruconis gallopava TaxID=253628 RepID=A0A0D2A134_9PEZI|nr:uncharacterized protein PV09_08088 [Verruconis gallopava]KIW00378.1 hypothetical protein PV09_08088 [Verruconis gallopava]
MSRQSHPDSNLHPVATGAASALVAAHSSPKPLVLYSGWFCPFVQRVWAVLEEKQIPYQYVEVNPYNKPDSLLKINPRGLVPTLEIDGKPLYESWVVMEFLEDRYPDLGNSLRRSDIYERAKGRIWGDFVGSRIIPSFHRFLQHQPMSDTESLSSKRQELLSHLRQFTQAMDPVGPYFFGSDPSLTDFMLAPWAVRLWVFDHFKGGLGIPEEGQGGKDEEIWRRWRFWLKNISERRSMVQTLSDREHYLPIYERYANDEAQSELAKATRSGRGVP